MEKIKPEQEQTIADFRGDKWEFQYLNDGKVVVTRGFQQDRVVREFNQSVFPDYDFS